MAPRRSARSAAATPAPATQPLEDCVLAFVGRFTSEGYSHAKLNTLTSSLGGRTSKSVTKDTTHLIYTINDYDPMTTNWITAKNKDIPIVTLQWLIECEKEQAKVNEVPFQANASAAAVAAHKKDEAAAGKASKTSAATTIAANGAKTDVVTNRKKRAASEKAEDDDDEPEPPKTKKAKETKSKAKANGKKAEVKEEEDADEVLEEETPVAEGQFLKKKGTSIPVDSLWMEPGYQVHVGDDGMIWDASLNQANSANNNNKFYILQILHNPKTNTYKTWSRWGRVGESGQNASLGNGSLDDAIKQFEKKFKDKSGLTWENRGNDPKPNKYAFVERSYESDSEEDEEDEVKPKKEGGDDEVLAPVCTLEKPVMDLMNLIFNQEYFQATMSALNYDAKKLPLGKLSKATITRGFQQLKDLAALMNDWSLAQSKWGMTPAAATQHLSNTYYSLIPHAFGRNRPPVINDGNLLKNEIELLESLSDMKDAADIMKVDKKAIDNVHTLDRHFQGLNLNEMSVLDKTTDEFTLLAKYLNDSRGSTHNMTYKIQDIFRIERQGEHARFDASEFGSMKSSNRRLLWHGSRCTNFGGILSQGLRIAPPEAPVTGYMFGKGIYLADMSSKSAGYCASGLSQGNALLLLCEAELGDPMQELTQASYEAGETAKKQGMVSTWGKGRTGPSKWIDAEAVHPSLKGVMMPDVEVTPGNTGVQGASLYYNEYICYDVSQIKLRYLLRVKI